MKRVLITTFPGGYMHHGGGEREIHLLKEALNIAGVFCDLYGPSSLPIEDYQEIIHFSIANGSDLVVDAASVGRKRMILWPNLWFVDTPTDSHLDHLRRFVSRFDGVVFKSFAEEKHFKDYFDISGMDVIHVSPIVSSRFFTKEVSPVFKESYGLDKYVIWPGIIEPQKNQLTAVRAFIDSDIVLVISGQIRDKAYFELCQAESRKNVQFIPPMPFASELHLSAIAYSSLFLELPLDFPGTSAIEAAVMGCRMLLPTSAWVDELLKERCMQVPPLEVETVRSAVAAALKDCNGKQSNIHLPDYSRFAMDKAILPLLDYYNVT